MYGKLFTSMYDGSLCTVGPWEALITFQQLVILADKNGVVDMTAEAIARRTTIPLDVIQKGLAALQEADPQSRTPDEEGRRILLLSNDRDWGWKIVNYQHYRSIRTADDRREYLRQYQQNYRAKRKQNVNTSTARKQCQPKKPIAEAEAEAYKSSGFEEFWKSYPRRVGKQAAWKVWRTLKFDDQHIQRVIQAVETQKTWHAWTKDGGQFIPYPATWLNQRRWEDEPPMAPLKRKWTIQDAI